MNRLAGETTCPTAKWFGCNVGQAVLPAFRGVRPILGERALSVSEYSALRAGIFKASGSFDPIYCSSG